MSYDLALYKLKAGASISEVGETDMPEEGEPDLRPIEVFSADERTRIQSVIAKHFPVLDGTEREELGVVIEVFDEQVGIAVAYWHKGRKAAAVMRRVWALLVDLQARCGLSVYDSQLGRGLDLGRRRDLRAAIKVYRHTVKAMG